MMNSKSQSHDIFNNIFRGVLDSQHLKENLVIANFKTCSNHLEEVYSLVDNNKLKEKEYLSPSFIEAFESGSIYLSLFGSKERESTSKIYHHFVSNNGIRANSPYTNDLIVSVASIAENLFLFIEGDKVFLLSFACQWKYPFCAVHYILCNTGDILSYSIYKQDTGFIANQVFRDLSILLKSYLLEEEGYLNIINKKPKSVIVTNLDIPHLGHSIWNGMSGWSGLLKNPEMLDLSTQHFFNTSVFNLSLNSDLIEHKKISSFQSFKPQDYQVLFLRDNWISEALQTQIITGITNLIDEADVYNKYCIPRDKKLVLLNLRLGNRSLMNTKKIYTSIIQKISANSNDYFFIIDGMNSSNISATSSHANMSMAGEHEVANSIVKSSKGAVVSIIGCTIEENVIIANNSFKIIAPWGAGLAKYSWLCRKEVLVYSSNNVLRNKSDKHIYDSDKFVENAVPNKYILSEYIYDQIDNDRSYRSNFVGLDGFSDYIVEYIRS